MKKVRMMSILLTIVFLVSGISVSSVFADSDSDSSESTSSGSTSSGDAIISADGKSATIIVPTVVNTDISRAVSSLIYKEKN